MAVHKIDRYEVQAELGRGGMATVYRAYDPRFKRVVAVKVLPREFLHDPNFRARFEREAETIAKLEHAAIVPVYDYGEENGQPYLVMRYMGGGSLAERIEDGPLALGEISTILARLTPALDKAHRQGIIHRDLKPGNILFDEDGNAYLSDFGIVKIAQSTSAITESGGVVGTPAYMAPEQVHGETPVDFRADLYALGVILFEMLAGRRPYTASASPKLMMKHVMDPIPDISEVRKGLDAVWDTVIQQAMAKNPEARFQSARDLAKAAASAAGESTPTGLEAPTTTRRRKRPAIGGRPVRPSRRRVLLIGGIAAVLIGVVIAGVLVARQGAATPAQGRGVSTAIHEGGVGDSARFAVLREIQAPEGADNVSLSLSPDSTMLAGSWLSREGSFETIQSGVWDVETGRRVRTFEPRTREEWLTYTADGTLLAFQNEGLEAALVNMDGGETIIVFTGLTGSAYTLRISPDESLVASLVESSAGAFQQVTIVSLWAAASGELEFVLDDQSRWETGAFSPDSRTFAAGSRDNTIVLWDTATGERLRTIRGHTQWVEAIAWLPDAALLASAANDGTVVIWDAATGERHQTFEIEGALPRRIAVSPDGRLLAAGTSDGRVLVWGFQSGEQVAVLTEHTPNLPIDFVLFSSDGALLITATSRGGEIIVWQVSDG